MRWSRSQTLSMEYVEYAHAVARAGFTIELVDQS